MSTPYTYLIGWPELDTWYYGVRYSTYAHPSDLWVKYFTSSKHVRTFIKNHGQPSIIQIRRVFSNAKAARVWESKVLRRMQAAESNRFLNLSYSDGNFVASPEHLLRLKDLNKGRVLSTEHREKLSAARRGKTKSVIHKQNIAIALTGKQRPDEVRRKISTTRKARGIISSTQHMNNKKYHCSECNKTMTKGNYVRWHSNC